MKYSIQRNIIPKGVKKSKFSYEQSIMKYYSDYHQLRRLPTGLLKCEHNLIDNEYAHLNEKVLREYYDIALNDSTIVANSSPGDQSWIVTDNTELTLRKYTKGSLEEIGIFVVLKYKGSSIYPLEHAFLVKRLCQMYYMGNVGNPESYKKVADFHNCIFCGGETSVLEKFKNEADKFIVGLEWFVNKNLCNQPLDVKGTILTYNTTEQQRLARVPSVLCAIRSLVNFYDVIPSANDYVKESFLLLQEFQSPRILLLRRERIQHLLTESDSAEFYQEIRIDQELEKSICYVNNFIEEHKKYFR